MIHQIDVRIEAPVRDTEVTDRVSDAVHNLFPTAELDHQSGTLVGETHSMDAFSEQLHEQEILDTARREITRREGEEGFSFALKKQAAFKNVINFAVGSPDELGDIEVHVTVAEPGVEAFIDYIAPPTREGRPIDTAEE